MTNLADKVMERTTASFSGPVETAAPASFWDHLDELRGRVLKALAAIVAACFLFYPFVDQVLDFFIKPVGHLVFTAPAEAFVARMMLTLLGGAMLALPVILYQVWSFVAVGLKEKERKYILLFGPLSFLLFFFGVAFACGVAIPWALQFLLSYASPLMVPMITVKNYISFVGTTMFSFGVIFELPLVLMFLAKIGIATPAFLTQKRKHAVLLIFIVSAFITPPDGVTLFLLAGPLIILYEAGVWASRWAAPKAS